MAKIDIKIGREETQQQNKTAHIKILVRDGN